MLPPFHAPLVRLYYLFAFKRVFAKCEHLAPSGSFKYHGIRHLLDYLSREGQTRQLVVPSMGNTALAAALGAKECGFSMVGVVPQTISRAKDEKLQAMGVELVKIAGGGSDLLRRAKEIAAERGAYFVHPHLDPHWTDGYKEIAAQILDEDLRDCRSLVFPVGGGGLLMGLTEHLRRRSTPIQLYGCEAYNYPTYARFDHARTKTIADGLVLETPHAPVQERICEMKVGIHMVSDDLIRVAMREMYERHALLVEPSSAITVAFAMEQSEEMPDPIAVILTGDNIAREDFARLIPVEDSTK